MEILVTGCAGFIGAALSRRLLETGNEVVGVDNLNDYYDPGLKQDRLALLSDFANFSFRKLDISDREQMEHLFMEIDPRRVVHLAAQAGVRYSISHPHSYISANIAGFLNILEGCRAAAVEPLVYASSSSVYGANENLPFSESDPALHPVSLYGATKRANELMAHSYSHLYDLPVTGLRYFTVYGPWGRPDMSPILFAGKLFAGEPLQVFNRGEHRRDFTYIDDVVEATVRITDRVPDRDADWDGARPDPATGPARCRIYNIGNQNAVNLMDYIKMLEHETGRKAVLEFVDAQPGDVLDTLSDTSRLRDDFGFAPAMPLEQGIKRFVEWYKRYYGDVYLGSELLL
ncbi:MAG: NAD-dependent epimerase/dehydratase family protein [Gammaproteobacteria bacterium]|nr:NAD-dependent epimerase/dehydratase family protein [Gammaproteobacteria bacterium]